MKNLIGRLVQPGGKKAKLSILIYHRVLDEADHVIGEIDRRTFRWHLAVLKRHFNVLGLSEAMQRLQQGTLPPRAAVITFDDGYKDNVTNALPILQEFDMSATFFIATGFLGGDIMWNDRIIEAVRLTKKTALDLSVFDQGVVEIATPEQRKQAVRKLLPYFKYLEIEPRLAAADQLCDLAGVSPQGLMMAPEEVKVLRDAGMEIGGHTVRHPILAAVDDVEAKREIEQGKSELEDILNEKLTLFAYPNGKPNQDYQSRHMEMVKNAGFTTAVSTAWGVTRKHRDPFQIPRFTPWDEQPQQFLIRLWRNAMSKEADLATL